MAEMKTREYMTGKNHAIRSYCLFGVGSRFDSELPSGQKEKDQQN